MKTKKLTSGFEVPVLGFGTFGIGGGHERDASNDEKYIKAIKDALDLGFTHIDTAEIYGANHTEELIAKAIEGYDRKNLFIASKVDVDHLRYSDVLKACKASLERLKTEHIDLYLVHAWNPEIPIQETMKALNELIDKGVVKNIGVCNFTIEQLQQAQKHSKAKIVMNQMKYCLWTKNPPDLKTMKYCQENDIMITAYKLFGRGKIEKEKIGLIQDLAKKYNKTEAQIITNWVISKKNTVAIFKSLNKEHMKENIEALDFKMEAKDYDKIDLLVNEIFPK
jgi:diketogulonate reductase-like aldo/keto reductase